MASNEPGLSVSRPCFASQLTTAVTLTPNSWENWPWFIEKRLRKRNTLAALGRILLTLAGTFLAGSFFAGTFLAALLGFIRLALALVFTAVYFTGAGVSSS